MPAVFSVSQSSVECKDNIKNIIIDQISNVNCDWWLVIEPFQYNAECMYSEFLQIEHR